MDANQCATVCGCDARQSDQVVHISHPYASRMMPATTANPRPRRGGIRFRAAAIPKSRASSTLSASASHMRRMPILRSCGTTPILFRYSETELCIHASAP